MLFLHCDCCVYYSSSGSNGTLRLLLNIFSLYYLYEYSYCTTVTVHLVKWMQMEAR